MLGYCYIEMGMGNYCKKRLFFLNDDEKFLLGFYVCLVKILFYIERFLRYF